MEPVFGTALPENTRIFFRGVSVRPRAIMGPRLAGRWREGHPEWLRPLVAPAVWRDLWPDARPPMRAWAIDFPPGTGRRAEPAWAWQRFSAAHRRLSPRNAGSELRIALAKTERYLATPAARRRADWRWVPGDFLPLGGLMVLARDDEFLAAVAASRWLEVWRGPEGRTGLTRWRAFPFPWAPDTPRSALSRGQEDCRTAVVQAARAAGVGESARGKEGAAEDLDTAVAAAYGWPSGISEGEALARLRSMHHQRVALGE